MHGKVDVTKAQQQEELNEILRRVFKSGLLRRVEDAGMRMETPYGDPLVRITFEFECRGCWWRRSSNLDFGNLSTHRAGS